MGVLTIFIFEGAIIDWLISKKFGALGMPPIEAPLWNPKPLVSFQLSLIPNQPIF
jgi:hypothetical protein